MVPFTNAMKREIVSYLLTYSKGLIEDSDACPELCRALDVGAIKSGDIEQCVEQIKNDVLKQFAS